MSRDVRRVGWSVDERDVKGADWAVSWAVSMGATLGGSRAASRDVKRAAYLVASKAGKRAEEWAPWMVVLSVALWVLEMEYAMDEPMAAWTAVERVGWTVEAWERM